MRTTTSVATVVLAGMLLVSCSSGTTTAGPGPEQAPLERAPVQQAPVKSQARNVSVELLNLYDEYREYLANAGTGSDEFRTALRGIAIIEERVVIDAAAQEDAERLQQDLAGIGAVYLAVAQSVVSCQLPILAIPRLQELDSLKLARPSYVTTR